MAHAIDEVALRPGGSVDFISRDDLLEKLDALDQDVPARHEGRTKHHREHYVMVRYLRFVAAGADLLPFPMKLTKTSEGQDPPDFVLSSDDGRTTESFEVTDGSTKEYQKRLSAASATSNGLDLPVPIDTPEREASEMWAAILYDAFLAKAEMLVRGRFNVDHLLIYDLTGLGLLLPLTWARGARLLPLARGTQLLKQRIQEWRARERPQHHFRRISVLRDQALLLDIEGEAEVFRNQESPHFRLPVVRASGEEDLNERLRKIDRLCRESSIRHLKLFGTFLGDRGEGAGDFREEDSDVDVLVEFEPGTRVTLLDMARLERELRELVGFKVDLRTAEDLSRYFRREVLQQAVRLDAAGG